MVVSGAVTYAGRVQSGDAVLADGEFKMVSRVRRAQGRKPKAGENLHLLTDDDEVIKLNSLQPVRVVRPTRSLRVTDVSESQPPN